MSGFFCTKKNVFKPLAVMVIVLGLQGCVTMWWCNLFK